MNNCNIFILEDVNIPEYHISLIPDNQGSFQQLVSQVFKLCISPK